MQKLIVFTFLFLIGFSCFAQNKNSKAGDWYFYYHEDTPEDIDFGDSWRPVDYYPNSCSYIISKQFQNGKIEIGLDSVLRDYRTLEIVKEIFFEGLYRICSNPLGDTLIFGNDTLESKMKGKKFLLFPSLNYAGSFVVFDFDSILIEGEKIYNGIQNIEGFQDSIFTFQFNIKKLPSYSKYSGKTKFYFSFGKQLGIIEFPDFYQILHLDSVSTVSQYRLKFGNNPLIGLKSLKKSEFYDFELGDIFYFKGFDIYGDEMRRITEIDSTSSSDSIKLKYQLYKWYIPPNEPPSLTQRSTNIGFKKIDEFKSPANRNMSGNWNYFNLFYFNARLCYQTMSGKGIYFDSTLNAYTSGKYGGYFEQIFCEGLGQVYDGYIYQPGHTSLWFMGEVLIDYKKGSEVLTGIESTFLETTTEQDFYPNPTNGNLFFKGHERISDLKIFDTTGKLVVNKPFLFSDFLNLNGLAEGAYFITYQKNYQGYTQKLIIER